MHHTAFLSKYLDISGLSSKRQSTSIDLLRFTYHNKIWKSDRWTNGRTIKPTNKIINNVIKDCKDGTAFNLDHTDMQKIVIIELLEGGWLIKMSSPRKIYCTSPWNRNQQSSMNEQWHNYSCIVFRVFHYLFWNRKSDVFNVYLSWHLHHSKHLLLPSKIVSLSFRVLVCSWIKELHVCF